MDFVLNIIHARILTMDEAGVIEDGYLTVDGDRIVRLGTMGSYGTGNPGVPGRKNATAQASDVVIDAKGAWLLPGFIDAHSHLGLFNDGLDFEGSDGNEDTDPVTPQLRAVDGIHPADLCFKEAYEAGVSVVMTGPGSGNVLGGQFALIRTYDRTVDRAIIQAPSAQKVALGENPKRVYGKENKSPSTRMGTASLLRDMLYKAVEYQEKWDDYYARKSEIDEYADKKGEDLPDEPDRPDFDLQLESLLPVLSGSIPLKIHAHRQDDILTGVRICNEFGLKYTLEHCTEGHLIADVLLDEYNDGQEPGRGTGNTEGKGGKLIGAVVGPTLGERSKPELSSHTIMTAGVLQKAGIPVAIMTDHPSMPQQYLALSAALAVKGGMPAMDALSAITLTAARICGIDDQYGSLREEKKADFTLFSGDPLDTFSKVLLFAGHGQVRYDPDRLYANAVEGI